MLESFVAKARDNAAALKFIKAAMKRYGSPKVIVTDRLRSYGTAMKEIGNADRQETGRQLHQLDALRSEARDDIRTPHLNHS